MMSRAFAFVLVLLCGAGFAVALGGNRALLQDPGKKIIIVQQAAPAPKPPPPPPPAAAVTKQVIVVQAVAATPAPTPKPSPTPSPAPAAVVRCFGHPFFFFKKFGKCVTYVAG
eukprot:jgi/Chrzof1/7850/Cz02g38240.t1